MDLLKYVEAQICAFGKVLIMVHAEVKSRPLIIAKKVTNTAA